MLLYLFLQYSCIIQFFLSIFPLCGIIKGLLLIVVNPTILHL